MSQLTLIAPLVVRVTVRDGESRSAALDRAAAALADGLDALCHTGDAEDSAVTVAARGKVRVTWDRADVEPVGERERPRESLGVEH